MKELITARDMSNEDAKGMIWDQVSFICQWYDWIFWFNLTNKLSVQRERKIGNIMSLQKFIFHFNKLDTI